MCLHLFVVVALERCPSAALAPGTSPVFEVQTIPLCVFPNLIGPKCSDFLGLCYGIAPCFFVWGGFAVSVV